jgi:soluble lytic murein transglycosylase-like protein
MKSTVPAETPFFRLTVSTSALRSALTATTIPVLCALCAHPVRADIYTYRDKNGRYHFTNIRPRGRKAKKWKVLYRTGPGKAAARRNTKRDVVPARDHSKSRFHRYDTHIFNAAKLYKIPVPLIRAVIHTESDYDPRVVSSAGAKGLMQLMPQTAKEMGVKNVFDPRQNIYGGVRYLRLMANKFKGDILLTLAAYHAGPGAVRKYRGIPPYATTMRYVRIVVKRYYRYKKKQKRNS